jgi:soluble lytic murein transglycosylase-like protein
MTEKKPKKKTIAKKILIGLCSIAFLVAFHFGALRYVTFYQQTEARLMKKFVGSKAEEVYRVIKDENTLDSLIHTTALKNDIPTELWKALISIESGGNPGAKSHKGCIGLAQINPTNLKRCNLSSVTQLYNPKLNLACGAQILTEEYKKYKSWAKALAVYNCGKVSCSPGKLYAFDVLVLSEKYKQG